MDHEFSKFYFQQFENIQKSSKTRSSSQKIGVKLSFKLKSITRQREVSKYFFQKTCLNKIWPKMDSIFGLLTQYHPKRRQATHC